MASRLLKGESKKRDAEWATNFEKQTETEQEERREAGKIRQSHGSQPKVGKLESFF
jgi:hypothetical protein